MTNICLKQTKNLLRCPISLKHRIIQGYIGQSACVYTMYLEHPHAPLPSSTPSPISLVPFALQTLASAPMSSVHIWLYVSIATRTHKWGKTYGKCLSETALISLIWLYPFSRKQLYSTVLYVWKKSDYVCKPHFLSILRLKDTWAYP